ncbi:MAG: hypothetical protein OWQ59_06100 [Alicyclobacillaceae bacterium]|jgi:hypothetical protein|nr:hypothetical protein [Alicyclobacillaceae bacterium]
MAIEAIHLADEHKSVLYRRTPEMPKPELWIGRVMAFRPENVVGVGKMTCIMLEDGTDMYIPWSIATTYAKIAEYYGICTAAHRHLYKETTNCSQYVPLIAAAGKKVFCAFKCCAKAESQGAGTTAYIAASHIVRRSKVPGVSAETILHLSDGRDFRVYMREKKVIERIRQASLLMGMWRSRQNDNPIFLCPADFFHQS